MLTRMIERGSQVREGDAVYGYVNENENEGQSGQPVLMLTRDRIGGRSGALNEAAAPGVEVDPDLSRCRRHIGHV
jgi:hypothetical protein